MLGPAAGGREQHQPGVQHTDVRRSLGAHGLQDGLKHQSLRVAKQRRRHVGGGRIGAHPARIRARVAICDPFVIARGRHQHGPRAIAKGQQGDLAPAQALLDDDMRASGPEFARKHDPAQCRLGGLRVVAHKHAFARGQTVGLDHAGGRRRKGQGSRKSQGLIKSIEDREIGGRHAARPHDRLGEELGGLELGRGAPRPKHAQARAEKDVDDPGGQRRFGPDHRQVNLVLARESEQSGDVVGRNVHVVAGGSGVPGRDVDTLDPRRLKQFPGQSVFAPAIAHDEDVHSSKTVLSRSSSKSQAGMGMG